MGQRPGKTGKISRRKLFPILGGSLLFPILGFPESTPQQPPDDPEEEFETLLKPDGTTVKVRKSTVRKAKILKKNLSNTVFLKWLGKKV